MALSPPISSRSPPQTPRTEKSPSPSTFRVGRRPEPPHSLASASTQFVASQTEANKSASSPLVQLGPVPGLDPGPVCCPHLPRRKGESPQTFFDAIETRARMSVRFCPHRRVLVRIRTAIRVVDSRVINIA
ncbi:hypothetical protein HRR80_004440 [Exophiala dermatitidis]|uniref:Uncharacterized protein n=1 Tax=Exophiala dermatitidis TaxID=5970 RepID=A0AAN6EVI3_EXODE|nr:hypothetical protein HRR77_003458 [Exophiala dermatitidis]KAJ4569120.1 hypothetical protein HRR82_007753 [Exophiala dermatitidis]KAJ4625336.1 hypothetical protein HRR86_004818 [Exophiala dermatitidis]KAJ8991819.1 hypothetical protein HRR80_004440 [Exophiala dermatitidis]